MRIRWITLMFSFLIFSGLYAQETLLKSFEGKWEGQLEIYSPFGLAQKIPMELHILPIDSTWHSWTLIYGKDKKAGLRDYRIRCLDIQTGEYEVDEQNSIVLSAYEIGGKLYERFEVQGNLLLATTELVGGKLLFEIISGLAEETDITGGGLDGDEEVPAVKNFKINVRQKALLTRQKS